MTKKTRITLSLILLCVVLTCSSTTAFATVYRKTTSKVNLRSQAGSTGSSTIITTIPKGSKVELIAKSTKYPNWFYISYNGKDGFVEGTYLTAVDTPGTSAIPSVSAGSGYLSISPLTLIKNQGIIIERPAAVTAVKSSNKIVLAKLKKNGIVVRTGKKTGKAVVTLIYKDGTKEKIQVRVKKG